MRKFIPLIIFILLIFLGIFYNYKSKLERMDSFYFSTSQNYFDCFILQITFIISPPELPGGKYFHFGFST